MCINNSNDLQWKHLLYSLCYTTNISHWYRWKILFHGYESKIKSIFTKHFNDCIFYCFGNQWNYSLCADDYLKACGRCPKAVYSAEFKQWNNFRWNTNDNWNSKSDIITTKSKSPNYNRSIDLYDNFMLKCRLMRIIDSTFIKSMSVAIHARNVNTMQRLMDELIQYLHILVDGVEIWNISLVNQHRFMQLHKIQQQLYVNDLHSCQFLQLTLQIFYLLTRNEIWIFTRYYYYW